MIKAIIFDFNRTIYLPEFGIIPRGTIRLLERLKKKGLKMALVSMSEGRKQEIIREYGLSSYFSVIKMVKKKDEDVFVEVMDKLRVDADEIAVIGDRIRSEITIGNSLGMRTVWLRQGKFRNEIPISEKEMPDFVVEGLLEVMGM